MQKQENSQQNLLSLDILRPERTTYKAQTETGKILKVIKMQRDHSQFSENRLPVMFRIQTPQSDESYVLTYNQLRKKNQQLLLSYFQNITRIHDFPQSDNLQLQPHDLQPQDLQPHDLQPQNLQPQDLQPIYQQPGPSVQDDIFLQEFFAGQIQKSELMGQQQILAEAKQINFSSKMEQKAQMSQFDLKYQYFQDIGQASQKPKKSFKFQSLIPILESKTDQINFNSQQSKQNEKFRPQCVLAGKSGCYDVQLNDSSYIIQDIKAVHDFDYDLDRVSIAPYRSDVFFQPITTNVLATAQEAKDPKPKGKMTKKQNLRQAKKPRKPRKPKTEFKKEKNQSKRQRKQKIISKKNS